MSTVSQGLVSCLLLLSVAGCSRGSSNNSSSGGAVVSEDASASGAAAGAVGQALSGSSSTGTMALNSKQSPFVSLLWSVANASNVCPTVKTASGAGCTQNGNAADLVYSSCSFGRSAATWSGTHEVTLSSGTAVSCGTFPVVSSIANGQSIQRQYVTSGAPGSATRTSAFGTVITVDHASANLSNFDTGTTIAANIGSGYGSQVTFDGSGHRRGVVVAEHISSMKFDHSIFGNMTISESNGTRTISSATLTIYHNRLRVVGTATFTNVQYDDTCATPIAGTIQTHFANGAHVLPTTAGTAVVGKSETLTFNGCGNQTLVDTTGASTEVSISGV